MATPNETRWINGVKHKLCKGVSHDSPTFLPLTEKYFYRVTRNGGKRGFMHQCRMCSLYSRAKIRNTTDHWGLVPAYLALPIYNELVNRLGFTEAARRTGISQNGLRNVIYGKTMSVQRGKLRLVALELVSARRKGETLQVNGTVRRGLARRANGVKSTCSGCGTHLDNYTDGCKQCDTRKRKREGR